MKPQRRDELFRYYVHYWIIKLKLDEKYKFNIRKDNRIDCHAYVEPAEEPYRYLFKYNTKWLTTKYKIIAVVLHELAHIMYDLRTGDNASHEYVAELFSLKTAKECYPKMYPKMVNWTKQALKSKTIEDDHKKGYTRALVELGEYDIFTLTKDEPRMNQR